MFCNLFIAIMLPSKSRINSVRGINRFFALPSRSLRFSQTGDKPHHRHEHHREHHPKHQAHQRPGHHNPLLGVFNLICKVYSTVIRGTPMMVQLLIMSMVIFKTSREYTLVGALSLGINSGAYVSEIIRGGLMAVDPGQMEAGRSLGLNYVTTMVSIVIPQAIKSVLPALGNEFVVLLKDTSLITVIGGKELLYAAQGIMNRTYEAMYPLLGTAAIYLVLVMIFTWLMGKLEGRMRQSDRR